METEYLCGTLSSYLNTRGIFRNFSLEIVEFSTFGNAGQTAQGFAGKALLTNRAGITASAVFKVGIADDWTITLEDIISDDMCEILEFCPWITCGYGMEELLITRYDRRLHSLYGFNTNNPFKENRNSDRDIGLYKEVLFMQQAVGRNAYDYYNDLPRNSNESIHKIYAAAMQLFSGLEIAQTTKGFSHNDLHTNNYMIVPLASAQDLILTHSRRVNEGGEIWRLTPTYGLIPVVIDYGFSYSYACDSQPWYGSPAGRGFEIGGNYTLGPNDICDLFKAMNGFGGMVNMFTVSSDQAKTQKQTLMEGGNVVYPYLPNGGHFNDINTSSIFIPDIIRNAARANQVTRGLAIPDEIDLIKILVPFPIDNPTERAGESKEEGQMRESKSDDGVGESKGSEDAEMGDAPPVLPFPTNDVKVLVDSYQSIFNYPARRNKNIAANIYKQLFKACTFKTLVEAQNYVKDVLNKTALDTSVTVAGRTGRQNIIDYLTGDKLRTFILAARRVAKWISSILPPLIRQKQDFFSRIQNSVPENMRTVSNALDVLQLHVNIPDGINKITVFDSIKQESKTFTITPAQLTALQNSRNPVDDARAMYEAANNAGNTIVCAFDNSDLLRGAIESSPNCGVNVSNGKIECDSAYGDSP